MVIKEIINVCDNMTRSDAQGYLMALVLDNVITEEEENEILEELNN